jgi:hypothetical protein
MISTITALRGAEERLADLESERRSAVISGDTELELDVNADIRETTALIERLRDPHALIVGSIIIPPVSIAPGTVRVLAGVAGVAAVVLSVASPFVLFAAIPVLVWGAGAAIGVMR